jgi:hypothetical protein
LKANKDFLQPFSIRMLLKRIQRWTTIRRIWGNIKYTNLKIITFTKATIEGLWHLNNLLYKCTSSFILVCSYGQVV